MFSLISFSNILNFYPTSHLHYWLMPKYFLLLDAIENKTVLIISFLDGPLSVYSYVIDHCIFTLYPAPLLNLFISSKISLFFCKTIMVSIYKNESECPHKYSQFYFFISNWNVLFFYFSWLISLARTSSVVLNKWQDQAPLPYSWS